MFDWLKTLVSPTAVTRSIDAMVLTDEEKINYRKEMLKAYEPFKVLQRYLALGITGMFAFVLLIATVLFIGGLFIDKLNGQAEIYTTLEVVKMVGYAFVSVVGLYVSGGTIREFRKK